MPKSSWPRSAFLLHDVFGYSFAEVAEIVGRTPAAARQLATRGRSAVEARRPRYPAGRQQQREVVAAFQAATEDGDVASLIELLEPGVTFRSDGGGVVNAARTVFTGAERVARIFTAMAGHFGDQYRMRPIVVNGTPGLLLDTGEYPSVIGVQHRSGPDQRDRCRTQSREARDAARVKRIPWTMSAASDGFREGAPRPSSPHDRR